MTPDKPGEPIDLTNLNMETVEGLPSENPVPEQKENKRAEGSEKIQDEFEIRRRQFFGT